MALQGPKSEMYKESIATHEEENENDRKNFSYKGQKRTINVRSEQSQT